MLGPFVYDLSPLPLVEFLLYMSCSFDFYLYDLSPVMYLYLNYSSYVSYYNDSKVSAQIAVKSIVDSGRKFRIIIFGIRALVSSILGYT